MFVFGRFEFDRRQTWTTFLEVAYKHIALLKECLVLIVCDL